MTGATDCGFSDEDGTSFDGESRSHNVSNYFGATLDVDTTGGGQIAVNLAVDNDVIGTDLGLDACIFTNGEATVGVDLTLYFAVNYKIVGELHTTLNVHVRAENVAGGATRARRS